MLTATHIPAVRAIVHAEFSGPPMQHPTPAEWP
jgi:hypothetical protein